MKAGRKNLKRAAKEQDVTLQDGESIVRVVSLRGSNLIEVIDAKGQEILAMFPAKFQKLMWIKKSNFVVVDDSGKEKALESGSKVACMVSRVLFFEQVRLLQRSPDWPEAFRTPEVVVDEVSDKKLQQEQANKDKGNGSEESSEDDDGLPPLEANTNRVRPVELCSNADSFRIRHRFLNVVCKDQETLE